MSQTDSGKRREWVVAALEQYEARLTRFAIRLLGDPSAAADAVQHAFLRLCDEPPDKLAGRLDTWLFAVSRHKAIDLLRLRGRTEHLEGEPEALAGREPDPAQTAEQKDLAGRLNWAIDRLPLAQREVLQLWSEGFTYRQIASMTERTEVHVRVLVHRAVTALRNNQQLRHDHEYQPAPVPSRGTPRGPADCLRPGPA